MKDDELIKLFGLYLAGELSDEQHKKLDAWLAEDQRNQELLHHFAHDSSLYERWKLREKIDVEGAFRQFETKLVNRKRIFPFTKSGIWVTAAMIVLVFSVAGSLLWRIERQKPIVQVKYDIIPGSSKAVLVLETGETIALDKSDSIHMECDGANIKNIADRLIYARKENNDRRKLHFNELQIPKGGEYRLELSDGTKVLLNANTTIKYPTVFANDCRRLELSGEAFFNVAKSDVPFIVKVGEVDVEVYGTSFNINSNKKSKIQTTLVEGKVGIAVRGSKEKHMLSPSQMAEFNIESKEISIQKVDVSSYLAWTRGLFIFNNERLENIMEALGLWYDMEVFFHSPTLEDLHFTGVVKRYDNISVILDAIANGTNVKFRIKGKTLTVYD